MEISEQKSSEAMKIFYDGRLERPGSQPLTAFFSSSLPQARKGVVEVDAV